MSRRAYLDWLRGVAVLIMIEAHTLDSWTRVADRARGAYKWAIVVGGFGAPIFLFLAGVALALAAGSRLRKGLSDAEVAALARRRGWQIFGLAFLFRLQSAVLGGGGLQSLLKVDILNVMGLSMLVAAGLWGLGPSHVLARGAPGDCGRGGGDADAPHSRDAGCSTGCPIRSRRTSDRFPG